MNRLTFRENDKFGVVGMNEENQDKKLYACVLKLTDYENTGLSPNDILELKQRLEVKEQSKNKWKDRANIYADLIVELNNILPNKQKDGINFSKVIESVKYLLEEKDKEITCFAIQELEKVKIELKEKIEIMSCENHCYPQKVINWHTICEQINKQIENLKSNKKD